LPVENKGGREVITWIEIVSTAEVFKSHSSAVSPKLILKKTQSVMMRLWIL